MPRFRDSHWRRAKRRYAVLADAGSVEDVLAAARVTYHAPADASATELPAGCVDVIFSNSVLEHVEPEAIPALMRESRRILSPSGIAIFTAPTAETTMPTSTVG